MKTKDYEILAEGRGRLIRLIASRLGLSSDAQRPDILDRIHAVTRPAIRPTVLPRNICTCEKAPCCQEQMEEEMIEIGTYGLVGQTCYVCQCGNFWVERACVRCLLDQYGDMLHDMKKEDRG